MSILSNILFYLVGMWLQKLNCCIYLSSVTNRVGILQFVIKTNYCIHDFKDNSF